MKNFWIILIIGVVLRILLSVSTFHPDSLAFKLGGELIASGKILNLYDYSDPNVAVLNYPPLVYFFHGIFKIILGSFLGGVLLIKLPYIIFDLLTGYFLSKLFISKRESLIAFGLWIFNPINLFSTYMMGQFDIIPTFFTVLCFFLISRNRLYWAALALGGGIAFKIYPIFLVILIIVFGKNYIEKIKLFLLSLVPYSLSILPFLPSHSFRSTALFAAQSSKSLYASIPVSGGESILLFPASLIFFYLFLLRKKTEKIFFWKVFLVPLLLFFIFTHFHPQWFIWVTPFLILDLVVEKFKNGLPIILLFVSWAGSLFFFDPSLTIGMFAPIFPALKEVPSIWTILNLNLDYNLSRSLLQTIFVGSSVYLIYYHLKQNNA